MRASRQQCTWRSFVGAVAVGLFGFSIAYAGPRTDKASSTTDSVQAVETRRVVEVQPAIEGPLAVPTALGDHANRLEPLPQGMPIVITEVHMDMRTGGGIAAAGASQAAVFLDGGDSGFFNPIKASDVGTFVAQQMIFGNGWTPGNSINGYSMTIFNHSAGPSGPMTVRTSLWDGDPLGIVDTQCSAGGVPAEIPGTAATFGPLADASGNDSGGLCDPLKLLTGPCIGLWKLTASFDKVQINCNLAYMVTEPLEGCRVGWRLAGNTFSLLHCGPAIGFGDLVESAYDCGQGQACFTPTGFNAGFCCNTGAACDDTNVVDSCSHPTFCTSGVADTLDAFSFGANCPGYWATHVSDVQAATDVTFSVRPRQVGAASNGGSIVASKGDFVALMEFILSDYDPGQSGIRLKNWRAKLDVAGFTSGQAGTITTSVVDCSGGGFADCAAAWGSIGVGASAASCGYGAFPNDCTPSFIDESRDDYLFFGELEISVCDQRNVRCGSSLLVGDVGTTGGETYVMTIACDVPNDAKGTFTICPTIDDENTLLDSQSRFIPLIGLICGTVTVETGQCCDGFVCIGDTFTANNCAAIGGSFQAGKTCADDCACPAVSPALAATLALPGNPVKETNRVLPVLPGNAGSQIAILVTFDDLPFPFNVLNGQSMWAGAPIEYCENSGQDTPPIGGCHVAPGAPSLTFFASELQCSPFYTDWSGFSAVHIFGEFIVPDGFYSIQLIREGCDAGTAAHFSAALPFTTSKWGDSVTDCTTSPCGPPDGGVDVVTDVTAGLDKFKNVITGPSSARVDVEPEVIDHWINISDVTFVLDAFRGDPYPFEPSSSTACP